MNEIESNSYTKISVKPCDVPEKLIKKQKKGFRGFLNIILAWIKGYTVDDINRLKEAGVQIFEANAMDKKATAINKLAEAQKKFEESESVRIDNEIKKQLSWIDTKDISTSTSHSQISTNENDSMFQKNRIFNSEQRVLDAIQEIKSKGGQVVFDGSQVELILQNIVLREKKSIRNQTTKEEVIDQDNIARGKIRNPTTEELKNWNEFDVKIKASVSKYDMETEERFGKIEFDQEDLEVPKFLRRKSD